MLKSILFYLIFILTATAAFGRGHSAPARPAWPADTILRPYAIKRAVDLPLTLGGAAFTVYNFAQESKKDGSTVQEVQNLNKNDLNWLDRGAVRPYSKSIDQLSYIPFYVAMPLPLAVFGIDPKMRKDFMQLTFLYAESMILTGVLYSSGVHWVNRHRPLVYSAESPMDVRISSNSRNSFFAGHVALVATSTFFIARAFADYHPDSRYKWLLYSGAALTTAATAWWRYRAGEHFPSDIIVGTAVGTLSGLLTPALHKSRIIRSQRLSILPYGSSGQGLALLYKL